MRRRYLRDRAAAGTHQAQARLLGYQAAVVSFDVAAPREGETPAEPKPVVLMLEPLAPVLRLTSDLESGDVLLDGAPVGKLEDGQFELADLALGSMPSKSTIAAARRRSPSKCGRARFP